jgi:hypothetical protein
MLDALHDAQLLCPPSQGAPDGALWPGLKEGSIRSWSGVIPLMIRGEK